MANCNGDDFPPDGSKGAHRFLLQGSQSTRDEYARLRSEEHASGGSAALIAGAYLRTLEANHGAFSVDTEHTTTAVTLITPGLFADLRVPCKFSEGLAKRGALSECSADELRDLARTVSFCGFSVVRHDVPGYEGSAVCERLTCIDSQPPPRRFPNQWRIQPNWEKGGWVEWGARKDAHGQALYVEHWRRLPGGEAQPFLALRRAAKEGRDGFLLVVGDYFLFLDDRGCGTLPAVVPGQDGHSADRGQLRALTAKASTIEELRVLLSYCAAHGRVSDGWCVSLSSWPWLVGKSLLGQSARISGARVSADGNAVHLTELEAAVGEQRSEPPPVEREWEVLESSGWTVESLRALFQPPATPAKRKCTFDAP